MSVFVCMYVKLFVYVKMSNGLRSLCFIYVAITKTVLYEFLQPLNMPEFVFGEL